MGVKPRFLIIDGYPKDSRDQFHEVGMKLAWELYRDMLVAWLPEAQCDVWLSSDQRESPPTDAALAGYAGVLWPGCNLTVYHFDDVRVKKHLELVDRSYAAGVPQFGTCWGIQLAVVVAGGEVGPHDSGREMGIGRKIYLTDAGRQHPMYQGKPPVFEGFVSHDDEVKKLPECATLLASNYHSPVQAASVTYKKGTFWGLQYHPEYDFHEVARLICAREPKLLKQNFFTGHDDLMAYVDTLEALHKDPDNKPLRWRLGVNDDIASAPVRQREFVNWLNYLVLPRVP
jgi:GMP synthase (glutamine-hydrolysing)